MMRPPPPIVFPDEWATEFKQSTLRVVNVANDKWLIPCWRYNRCSEKQCGRDNTYNVQEL